MSNRNILGIDLRREGRRSGGLMNCSSRSKNRGFTLIEVLVVIAIIMTLGVLAFFGVGKATTAAHKATSMNNIKQLSAISVAEAGDNNGIFPKMHFGNLPFWVTYEWRNDNQISREVAYCPANECWTADGKDRCQNGLDLWEYNGSDEGSSSLFSYACLINDPIWTENGSFSIPDPDVWERIKDRVYNEDEDDYRWTPTRTGQEVAYPILWVDLAMNWNNRSLGNFMKKDGTPRGVHVGFLDGHIEWRQGTEIRQRFSKPGLTLYW